MCRRAVAQARELPAVRPLHGVGSSLTCDTGTPQPGDSCAPATAQPVCRTAHEALVCQGAQWIGVPLRARPHLLARSRKGSRGCK